MTGKWAFLIICAIGLILSLLIASIEAKRKRRSRNFIRIARLDDCPGQYPISLVNITQVSVSGGAINGFYVVRDDHLPSKMMAYFEALKCKTLEDASCEPFVSGMVDWCKIIVDKGQFYSPLFRAFHPPLKCPYKEGTYEIRNGTLSYEEMEKFMKVVPSEYHQVFWNVKYTLMPPGKPDKIKSCFYLVFRYYAKRA